MYQHKGITICGRSCHHCPTLLNLQLPLHLLIENKKITHSLLQDKDVVTSINYENESFTEEEFFFLIHAIDSCH